jgi:hypothetical protein
VVSEKSSVTINFGERGFNFDVESLCERLKLENPIIIDDSIQVRLIAISILLAYVQFWGSDVKRLITKRFRNCLSDHELAGQVNLRASVDLTQLVKRLEKLAGIRLSDRVHSYFKEDHNASFTLAGYDIVSLDSTYEQWNAHDVMLVLLLLSSSSLSLLLLLLLFFPQSHV